MLAAGAHKQYASAPAHYTLYIKLAADMIKRSQLLATTAARATYIGTCQHL